MIHITVRENNIESAIIKAVDVLKGGGIIAYPTETFYGLGVKFDMPDSLKTLYELKKRPAEKAMPVIIGSLEMLSVIVSEEWLKDIQGKAKHFMDKYWPGPLTLLLPAKEGLSEFLTSGTGKIAVRVPGESFGLHLVQRTGFPITATSANISGMPPADNVETVRKYFDERLDMLIDGGVTKGGLPSTVLDMTTDEPVIVRKGSADIII